MNLFVLFLFVGLLYAIPEIRAEECRSPNCLAEERADPLPSSDKSKRSNAESFYDNSMGAELRDEQSRSGINSMSPKDKNREKRETESNEFETEQRAEPIKERSEDDSEEVQSHITKRGFFGKISGWFKKKFQKLKGRRSTESLEDEDFGRAVNTNFEEELSRKETPSWSGLGDELSEERSEDALTEAQAEISKRGAMSMIAKVAKGLATSEAGKKLASKFTSWAKSKLGKRSAEDLEFDESDRTENDDFVDELSEERSEEAQAEISKRGAMSMIAKVAKGLATSEAGKKLASKFTSWAKSKLGKRSAEDLEFDESERSENDDFVDELSEERSEEAQAEISKRGAMSMIAKVAKGLATSEAGKKLASKFTSWAKSKLGRRNVDILEFNH